MSAMQIKVRRCIANVHSHSLSGWDFIVACQQCKLSSERPQQLTNWMEFYSGMLAESEQIYNNLLAKILLIKNSQFSLFIT